MLPVYFVLQSQVLVPCREILQAASDETGISLDEISPMVIAAAKAVRDRANDFATMLEVNVEIEMIEGHLCVAAVIPVDLELDSTLNLDPSYLVIAQDSYTVTLCKQIGQIRAIDCLKALNADNN